MRGTLLFTFIFLVNLVFVDAQGSDSLSIEGDAKARSCAFAMQWVRGDVNTDTWRKGLITEEKLTELDGRMAILKEELEQTLEKVREMKAGNPSIRQVNNSELRLQLDLARMKSFQQELNDEFLRQDKIHEELKGQKDCLESIKGNQDLLHEYGDISAVQVGEAVRNLDDVLFETSEKKVKLWKLRSIGDGLFIQLERNLDDVRRQQEALEREMFVSDFPSLFALNYGEKSQYDAIKDDLKHYISDGFFEAKSYLVTQDQSVALFIFLSIVMLAIYFFYKKPSESDLLSIGMCRWLELKNIQLLQRKKSAIVLILVLAFVLVFDNRPVIFRDLIVFLSVFPLTQMASGVLPKVYARITFLFAILVIPYLLLVALSPENVVFRIVLQLTAMLFMAVFVLLFRQLRKEVWTSVALRRLVFVVLGVLFASVAIAFLAGIWGYILLVQTLLDLALGTVFVGFFLFVVMVMTVGLLLHGLREIGLRYSLFIRKNMTWIQHRVVMAVMLLCIYMWVVDVLRRAHLSETFGAWIKSVFFHSYTLGGIDFSLGLILAFVVVLYLSVSLAKIIQTILYDDVLQRMNLSKGLPHTISVMVRYAIITLGVVLAFAITGLKMDKFTVILGAFGVGIGFGLQNIFNNLVSGFILLFERPLKLNDVIEVSGLLGKVKSIGIRSSNIKTFGGAEVIVPNGQLISNEVINWTLSDQLRRVEIPVGVSYKSDPHQVHDLLMSVLRESDAVLFDPEPVVLFSEFGESSLDFSLFFWTDRFDEWKIVRSQIIFRIFDILKENHIEIPFPQRDIHIIPQPQQQPKPQPKQESGDEQ